MLVAGRLSTERIGEIWYSRERAYLAHKLDNLELQGLRFSASLSKRVIVAKGFYCEGMYKNSKIHLNVIRDAFMAYMHLQPPQDSSL